MVTTIAMSSVSKNSKISTQLKDTCMRTIAGFTIDEFNQDIFNNIIKYIDREEGDFNPDKGLLFLGNPGSGKTEMMKSIQKLYVENNHPLKFAMKTMWHIPMDYSQKSGGPGIISTYRKGHWFYDEFGKREKEFARFYSDINVDIADLIIHERYLVFKSLGLVTHFTTNCTDKDLKSSYDPSTYSRLREMCNFITFVGPDRRKNSLLKPVFTEEIKYEPTEEQKKEWEETFLRECVFLPYQKFIEEDVIYLPEPISVIYDKLKKIGILKFTKEKIDEIREAAARNVKTKNWGEREFRVQWEIKGDSVQSKIEIEGKRVAMKEFFKDCKEKKINIEDLIRNKMNEA